MMAALVAIARSRGEPRGEVSRPPMLFPPRLTIDPSPAGSNLGGSGPLAHQLLSLHRVSFCLILPCLLVGTLSWY